VTAVRARDFSTTPTLDCRFQNAPRYVTITNWHPPPPHPPSQQQDTTLSVLPRYCCVNVRNGNNTGHHEDMYTVWGGGTCCAVQTNPDFSGRYLTENEIEKSAGVPRFGAARKTRPKGNVPRADFTV